MTVTTTLAETVNADNALDLWAYLIVGLPGTIGAVIAGVIGWKSRASHLALAATTDEIREQVVNHHPDSNLRDDLDEHHKLLLSLLARMDAHGDDTRKLRKLLARIDERTSRIGDEVRTDRELRRKADSEIRRDLTAAVERAESVIAKHHPEDAA